MAGGVAGTLSFVINATTEGVDKAFKAIQAGAGKVSKGFTAISDGIRNTFNMAGARDQLKAVNRQIRDMDRQIQSMSGRKLELNNQIGELNTQLEEAQNNLEHLQESGGSQEEINQQRSMIAELEAARNSAQREVARIGRMQDRRNQLETTRSSLQSQMDTPMGRIGGAIGAIAKVGGAVKAVGDAMKKTSSLIGKGFGNVKKVVSGVLGSVKKAVSAISKPIKIASSFAKKGISSFKGMGQAAGGVGEKAKSMLKSLIQFKLLGTIFSKIKGYFSDLTNSSWELKNATKELNGSFKTAMQPLYEIVAPIVLQIINLFNKATQAIATFFASLGGKSYQQLMQSAQALDKQKKAIAGAGGELQRQLMGFDELNILTEQSGSSDSIFNEEELGALGDLAEELANLWQNGEYAEFGRVLAEQVNEFTASLINMDDGVSMVGDIGAKVGKLLYGIVTAADEFFKGVEWQNIGQGIADFLNNAIKCLDGTDDGDGSGWTSLGELLSGKMGALLGIITGFLTGTGEDGQDGFDFGNLGDSLGKMLEGYFEGQYEYVSKYLTGDFWKKFRNKISQFFWRFKRHINNSVKTAGETIVEQVPEVLKTAGTFAEGILEWINEAISAVNETGDDGLTLAERLGKAVVDGITAINWNDTLFGKNGVLSAITGLGEALHGFIGKALDEMDKETDGKTKWQQIGESLAGGINGIDWEPIKALIGDASDFVVGLTEVITTAITNIHWDEVGQHLWDMFWNIKWVDLGVGVVNLLAGLGKAIIGIVKGCITRLGQTDWNEVGTALSNGLDKIDWPGVLKALAITAGYMFGGFLGGAVVTAVIAAFEGAKTDIERLELGNVEVVANASKNSEAVAKAVIGDENATREEVKERLVEILGDVANDSHVMQTVLGQFGPYMEDIVEWLYADKIEGIDSVDGLTLYDYLMAMYGGTYREINFRAVMMSLQQSAKAMGYDVASKCEDGFTDGVKSGSDGTTVVIDPPKVEYSDDDTFSVASDQYVGDASEAAKETMKNAGIEETVESQITGDTIDAVTAALQNPELTGKLTDLGKILVEAFKNGLNSFDKEQVDLFKTQTWAEIAVGISSGFDTVKESVKATINEVISMINNMSINAANTFNAIGSVSTRVPGNSISWTSVEFPQIPLLAKGAVIPANSEFLAILGDQKSGTNVEAPLTTIQEAVSNVVNQDMMYNAFVKALNDGNTNFNVYLDGRQITDCVTNRQKRNNRAYGV